MNSMTFSAENLIIIGNEMYFENLVFFSAGLSYKKNDSRIKKNCCVQNVYNIHMYIMHIYIYIYLYVFIYSYETVMTDCTIKDSN